MPGLLDEPITAETTTAGRPTAITWRGSRYPVRVLFDWDEQLYRIAATVHGSPAIGEIARSDKGAWRLRRLWTA